MEEFIKTFDLEDYGNEETLYSVEVVAEVSWVDEGIGSYEFWGSVGYHSDIQPEIQDLKIVRYLCNEKEVTPDDEFRKAAECLLGDLTLEDFPEVEESGPSSYDPEDYMD
jgi:hypothetical protein